VFVRLISNFSRLVGEENPKMNYAVEIMVIFWVY
jgi:hypothetical protein